jgi:hypothetical protein
MDKTYVMSRRGGYADANVRQGACEFPLNPRLDLARHSPDGFEWGYHGSGPAQLALAILADALNNDRRALSLYQQFKREAIAVQPRDRDWELSHADVIQMVQEMERDAERI